MSKLPFHTAEIWEAQEVIVVVSNTNVTSTIADTAFTISDQPITVTNMAGTAEITPTSSTGESNQSMSVGSTTDPDFSSVARQTSTGIADDISASITSGQEPTEASQVPTAGTTATKTPDTPAKGLPDGAVAGVAIACIVAGIAIGLAAAFILFRRRRKSNAPSPGFVALEERHAESKSEPQVNVTSSTHDAHLGEFLLDATPDKEIQAELCSLSELIYQHVETYYHEPQVLASSAEVAQCLVHIGYSPELSGLQAEVGAAVCLAPKTSRVGLRHVLSHIIFQNLDFNSGGKLSMLPPAVAAMAQTKITSENLDSSAISLARSRWRSLSALLLHPNPAERTPLPLSTQEASYKAHSLANELNSFLQLFVTQDSASRQDQTNHLQAVILECTKLGYVLLSQPGDWRFIFNSKATPLDRTRRIVVCPGLERLSHNDGTRYGSPKEVAAAEIVPL